MWLALIRPLAWALVLGVAVGVVFDSATVAGIVAGTVVLSTLLWRGYIRPRF